MYALLKKFGASTEEQIAGLIHDVSHSAFSHCIDYVLDEGSEKTHNHQDRIFATFVKIPRFQPYLKSMVSILTTCFMIKTSH